MLTFYQGVAHRGPGMEVFLMRVQAVPKDGPHGFDAMHSWDITMFPRPQLCNPIEKNPVNN